MRVWGGRALLAEGQQVQRSCGDPKPGVSEQKGSGCGQCGMEEG